MEVDERYIHEIVQKVMASVQLDTASSGLHGVFKDMESAIEAAYEAQKTVRVMTLDQREKIITIMRRKVRENAETLANMGVSETKMGNVGDKILKHTLVADKTPGTEDITTTAWSGDRGSDRLHHPHHQPFGNGGLQYHRNVCGGKYGGL